MKIFSVVGTAKLRNFWSNLEKFQMLIISEKQVRFRKFQSSEDWNLSPYEISWILVRVWWKIPILLDHLTWNPPSKPEFDHYRSHIGCFVGPNLVANVGPNVQSGCGIKVDPCGLPMYFSGLPLLDPLRRPIWDPYSNWPWASLWTHVGCWCTAFTRPTWASCIELPNEIERGHFESMCLLSEQGKKKLWKCLIGIFLKCSTHAQI